MIEQVSELRFLCNISPWSEPIQVFTTSSVKKLGAIVEINSIFWDIFNFLHSNNSKYLQRKQVKFKFE